MSNLPTMRVPLWYFVHENARHLKPVRIAVDWLRDAFDAGEYPWFSDQFVHPDDFPKNRMQEARVVSIFPHFLDHFVS